MPLRAGASSGRATESRGLTPSRGGGGRARGSGALDALADDDTARLVASLLPARQAEVVLLRVVGGLSTDEVAHITGPSPGAVRVLLHRALGRLATGPGPSS
ncbi:MAG: sigma factor-like helix-turn-helix DNA-binding protein [Acidimicrobiia bacterium]